MLWLILWFLCGLVAGAIYKSKGRDVAAAFLVGLIFGPIGVLLAALTPTDKAAQERNAVVSGEMKRCPKCAELVRHNAQVCRFCQHTFEAPASLAPGEIVKILGSGAVRCSACGGAVRADALRCKHCKQAFTQELPITR